jgi:hypothetical protein
VPHHPTLRSRTTLASIALALLLTVFIGSIALNAAPVQDTIVRCDPEVVAVEIGNTVSFTIFIEDVVDLYGADVQMSFDPTIAQVVDADPGKGGTQIEILDDFLSSDFTIRDRADNVAGTIWYANTQVNPSQPVSGSGPLARVTMESVQPGSFDVVITSSQLGRINGTEIPATARNCRVTFFDPNTTSKTYLPVSIAP